MQHPSSWSLFQPAPEKGHAPVNGGVIPITLPPSYVQQPAAIRMVSPSSTAFYSPTKLIRTLRGSTDESGKGSPDLSSPPTVPHENPSPVLYHHHHDNYFTQFSLRPWHPEGDFENKDEDLSIASSITTLWSTRVSAPRQGPGTSIEDVSVLIGKLGLQVTSLATSKPLPLSRPRQLAVFSSACAAHICKGFGLPGLTAAGGCAPGSGDHSDLHGDIERRVRPQESGDNVSCDVRFDSGPPTPRASAVSIGPLKHTEIHQGDVTCPHSSSFDVNEAKYVSFADVGCRQAQTTHHSKLTTGTSGSDSESSVVTISAETSPTMTINKTRSSMRTSTSTGKSWNQRLTGDDRRSPTPSTTTHTRTGSPTQVPHKACCISTSFKKHTERSPVSKQNVWSVDTMGTTSPLPMGSTSYPTIDSFHPPGSLSEGLIGCLVEGRAGDFTLEKNDSSSRRMQEVSASGDFRASSTRNEKTEPLILVEDSIPNPVTAGSINRESGELKTPTTTSTSSDKDNGGSISDFFFGVILDPHFTSTPITIHKDLDGSPSWKGFDVFPHSEYFKTFELHPALIGGEEKSMSMSGEVYESVSTGFPPSKRVVLASTTDVPSDKQSCTLGFGVERDMNTVPQPLSPPHRDCMSSVDSFFTVASFDEDSLSTVMCSSPVRNCRAEAPESLCPNSPSNKSNWTFYSASMTDSSSDSHDLSPGISEQDFIDLTLFHSSSMIKPGSNSSAASTQHVDSACQASSIITSQDSYISSSKTTEPSGPEGFVQGSGGSDAVRLIPCSEDDSTASQGSNRDASQNSKHVGMQGYWNSFQSHPRLEDRSSGHSSGGTPSRPSQSEEWKMFISGAETGSSGSISNASSFYSYDDDFNAFRAIQNSMLPCYLKLSSTTEMLVPMEYRPRPDSEALLESDFTSNTPHLIRGSSIKSASSDTTMALSEASRSVLGRPSAISISMPDLSHLDEDSREEGAYIMDLAYTTCMPVADANSSFLHNDLSTSGNVT